MFATDSAASCEVSGSDVLAFGICFPFLLPYIQDTVRKRYVSNNDTRRYAIVIKIEQPGVG
jgi:hypothetical protein